MVQNLPASARDVRDAGLIPGSERSPGGWHSNLPQYSCLENPMDRGDWWATVHGVTQSQTWLKWLSTQARIWAMAVISYMTILSPPLSNCFLNNHLLVIISNNQFFTYQSGLLGVRTQILSCHSPTQDFWCFLMHLKHNPKKKKNIIQAPDPGHEPIPLGPLAPLSCLTFHSYSSSPPITLSSPHTVFKHTTMASTQRAACILLSLPHILNLVLARLAFSSSF